MTISSCQLCLYLSDQVLTIIIWVTFGLRIQILPPDFTLIFHSYFKKILWLKSAILELFPKLLFPFNLCPMNPDRTPNPLISV